MLSIWSVGAIVIGYLTLLFVIAFAGDKWLRANEQHPVLYSLGLGVHCTSWAFFGTTTQAAQFGWAVVPTYAGIILVMAFMFPVLLRINRLCQQHSISSLADFIALRYQGAHFIAALITLLCFIGVIPYLALQLDAITKSINLLAPHQEQQSNAVGLYVAALMALFAILFGTRTLSLKDKHPGLLLTIAVESVIKLAGLTIVGIYVCYSLFDGPLDLLAQAGQHPVAQAVIYADSALWVYLSHVLLGVCSMFILPRQFHMNFVESNGDGELRTARWLFPLYLLAITTFVLPIALAGSMLLDTDVVSSDTFVLALPLHTDNAPVALAAFIGGLSATSSMIIVATLALGIMIANNLITPLWLKIRLAKRSVGSMQSSGILTIRRLTVLVVLSVAFWYHLNISQSAPLVKSGIVAIALLAQMLPAMLFGLYWSRSSVMAASLAMLAGLCCWIVWLLYPSLLASYYFNPAPSDAQLGRGFVLSLMVNCITFIIVSLCSRVTRDSTDARSCAPLIPQLAIRVADLMQLTARVLETSEQNRLLAQLSGQPTQGFASAALLQNVEHKLAGQVGPPSARVLLSAIAQTSHTELPELVDWVEEASQTFQFNHEVLQSSVQHIQQGISVLDSNLALLAWNDRYIDLFHYPAHFLHTGMPITSLLRYNARRGLLGNSRDVEADIAKRVAYMKAGTPYKYLRKQPDGRAIELNGSPLPGGGYVTTYSDITEYTRIQEALEQAKDALEARVAARTEQLHHARLEAELANESKTRFLAAAGHDLMQPFNAATLFASMLAQKTAGTELETLSKGVTSSLASAESLLTMLLDMTRLESGVLKPQFSRFALDEVLGPLVREFTVISEQKGLHLRYVTSSVWVHSDRRLLRRIVQNLLSNAIRYTDRGSVVIGTRRRLAGQVEIWVCDTGPGIAADKQHEVFAEFHQLDSQHNNPGLGLGLTIVERMSALLEHPVGLFSQLHKGTRFTVTLPRTAPAIMPPANIGRTAADNTVPFLHNVQVLLVENDEQISHALTLCFQDWGAQVICATDGEQAKRCCPAPPAIMLLDYHLNGKERGTTLARELRVFWGQPVPGILNTANREEGIKEMAARFDLLYLAKPVKPLLLRRAVKKLLSQPQSGPTPVD